MSNDTHHRTQDERLDAAIRTAQNLSAIAQGEQTRSAWMAAARAWAKAGDVDRQQTCIYNAELCKK